MFSFALAVAGFALLLASILPRIPLFSQPPNISSRALLSLVAQSMIWSAAAYALVAPGLRFPYALAGAVMSLASGYDISSRVIPNRLLAVGVALWGVLFALGQVQGALGLLMSALGTLVMMVLLGLLGRGALGAGDVKLVSYVALCLGFRKSLAMSALGFLFLAVHGLLARRRLKLMLPFAPFLWLGGLIALLLGLGEP